MHWLFSRRNHTRVTSALLQTVLDAQGHADGCTLSRSHCSSASADGTSRSHVYPCPYSQCSQPCIHCFRFSAGGSLQIQQSLPSLQSLTQESVSASGWTCHLPCLSVFRGFVQDQQVRLYAVDLPRVHCNATTVIAQQARAGVN